MGKGSVALAAGKAHVCRLPLNDNGSADDGWPVDNGLGMHVGTRTKKTSALLLLSFPFIGGPLASS